MPPAPTPGPPPSNEPEGRAQRGRTESSHDPQPTVGPDATSHPPAPSTVPTTVPTTAGRPGAVTLLGVGALAAHVREYIVVLTCIAIVVLGGCGAIFALDDHPEGANFFWVVAMFFSTAVVTRNVTVQRGRFQHRLNFMAFPAFIGASVISFYLVPLAAALATVHELLESYEEERDRRPRILFRFCDTVLAAFFTAATAATTAYLLPNAALVTAFVVGTVVGTTVSEILTFRLESLITDTPAATSSLFSDIAARYALPILTAILAAAVFKISEATLLSGLIPFALIIILSLVFRWQIGRSEARRWQDLELALVPLRAQESQPAIINRGIDGARRLFPQTSTVTIDLYGHDRTLRYQWAAASLDHIEVSTLPPRPPGPPDPNGPTIRGGRSRWLLTASRPMATEVGYTMPGGTGDTEPLGQITVTFTDPIAWTDASRNTFSTLVAALGATLLVQRTHERVVRESQRRAYLATRDALTGLGNRALLSERGPRIVEESDRAGQHTALILLDLDGFKQINDTLGHTAGDLFLTAIGQRITTLVRQTDIAIRLGGDEFAVLATALTSRSDCDLIVDRLAHNIGEPVDINGINVSVGTSIGIANHYPGDTTIEDLLQRADIALYRAKDEGRGRAIYFDSGMLQDTLEALTLAGGIRDSLKAGDGQLELHYQPQIDLASGRVVGAEALIRWNHPILGQLRPADFLHVVEHAGLIPDFTHLVVEQAVAARARMREALPAGTVSLNLMEQNLLDIGLPAMLESVLAENEVTGAEMVLEITETTAPREADLTREVLRRLRDLGCEISRDDFGMGYQAIEVLRAAAAPDEVKIDRDFIDGIMRNPRDLAIVHFVIAMVRSVNARIVAEGVSSSRHVMLLRQMGCHVGQGYYFAKPMPLDAFMDWICRWEANLAIHPDFSGDPLDATLRTHPGASKAVEATEQSLSSLNEILAATEGRDG